MKSKITCTRDHRDFRIYIDDLLHLHIIMENYIGMQSWLEGSQKQMFSIEIYTQEMNILLEYDQKEIWKEILELLDKNI